MRMSAPLLSQMLFDCIKERMRGRRYEDDSGMDDCAHNNRDGGEKLELKRTDADGNGDVPTLRATFRTS